jgi:hypothetical protein
MISGFIGHGMEGSSREDGVYMYRAMPLYVDRSNNHLYSQQYSLSVKPYCCISSYSALQE